VASTEQESRPPNKGAKNLSSADNPTRVQHDIRFDVLKIIGLLCIILAHTHPPAVVWELRAFDVPLMVIVSGCVFALSSRSKPPPIGVYLRRRIVRLVAPTWTFLAGFFLFTYVLFIIRPGEYPFSREQVLGSFALLTGIGYVWIIRVFLLVAIVAPFLLRLYRSLGLPRFLVALLCIYVAHEIIYNVTRDCQFPFVRDLLQYTIYDLLPYSCLFGLGICFSRSSRRGVAISALVSLAVLSGLLFYAAVWGRGGACDLFADAAFPQFQKFKEPARSYYLAYGVFAFTFLYLLLFRYRGRTEILRRTLVFVSTSSLWIYLWHILFVAVFAWGSGTVPRFLKQFPVQFVIIVSLSIAIAWLQKSVIGVLLKRLPANSSVRRLLSVTVMS
jgi:hypothetical protein